MEGKLLELSLSINKIRKINNAILYDTKNISNLEKEKSKCISSISTQCHEIIPDLTEKNESEFMELINKYTEIEKDYLNIKKDPFMRYSKKKIE